MLAPRSGQCQIAAPAATNFAPIEALEWQGQDSRNYDINAHLGQAMSVRVGSGGNTSILAGVAFELELTHASLIAECLPLFIRIDASHSALLQIMHSSYRRDLPAEYLAQSANMSRSNFMVRFERQIGVSPIAYLNQLRINQAQRLLIQTQRPSAEIAEQVGFHSDRAFRQSFRLQTGLAPSQYRE